LRRRAKRRRAGIITRGRARRFSAAARDSRRGPACRRRRSPGRRGL
jgi:hypothetical protein